MSSCEQLQLKAVESSWTQLKEVVAGQMLKRICPKVHYIQAYVHYGKFGVTLQNLQQCTNEGIVPIAMFWRDI